MRIQNNGVEVERQPLLNFVNLLTATVDRANARIDVTMPTNTGPQGDTGPQGIQGVPGNDGATGAQGIQGPQGDPATNLVTSVAGRQGVVVLAKADVGLSNVDNTTDAGKPVSTATQTALDGKAATGHNHTGVYEAANANIQAHVVAAHAPSNAQKNSDITKAEIETVLTGVISSHSHSGGGSDPWTYLRLANDFPTSSATAVDITGLGFAPAANQRYEFEAQLMLRTATATVNPRLGLAWATGLTDGVASLYESQAATTQLMAQGNINAALLIAVGGLANNTQSWPASGWGMSIAGTTPSGSIRLQMASETAGTIVTVKAGSFLKYRLIP